MAGSVFLRALSADVYEDGLDPSGERRFVSLTTSDPGTPHEDTVELRWTSTGHFTLTFPEET